MRIAICDDEKKCRETIIEYVTPYINEENNIIYEEFENGESLLSSYNDADQTFDIIFLDIEMHGLNGVQTAEKIRELDKNAILIFVTNHINFVSDTFRVGAFQFLVKPIKEQDFNKDFKRALEQHKIGHHVYTIKYKENTFTFGVKDILYIEVYNRHLRLWTNEGQYEFTGTLMAEEKKLSPYNFVNCHQSYLVNMNYIKRITSNPYFYIFGVLISKTLAFVIVKAIQFFKMGREGDISYKIFFPLILMPLATVLIIYVIYANTYDVAEISEPLLAVIAILTLITSNIFIIYIFEKQVKQEHERKSNMLIQQHLKLQRDYFQELAEKQKLSNKAMHDAKNQLYAITANLNSDEIEYAIQKMNELCSNVFNTIFLCNTGNNALDALINSKHKKINENNIDFSSNIFMSLESKIDDVDLCILIGNALDNAIEACERISNDGARWIKLKIMQIDDNLSIELVNTCIEDNTIKNSFNTIKKDKYLHGFGLKSMREITNKYDGDIEYTIENGVFYLKTFIPMPE